MNEYLLNNGKNCAANIPVLQCFINAKTLQNVLIKSPHLQNILYHAQFHNDLKVCIRAVSETLLAAKRTKESNDAMGILVVGLRGEFKQFMSIFVFVLTEISWWW